MRDPRAALPRVCLLAAAETSPGVLYGLYDVLSTVGAIYPEMTMGKVGDPLLDVKIVAAAAQPFRCYGDVIVEPHASLADLADPDVAVVCDMYLPVDASPRGRYPSEIAWLKRSHERGALVASVCSGSLILADAGFLDGLESAGHWAYREMFRDYYPKVTLRTEMILSLAGERDRIVTAGGVSSWQDLALYLIARLCGPEHAIRTAKIHILSEHLDGQLPFAVARPRKQDADAVIAECQAWIAENYASANPVARMAERAGLVPRTFARRFLAATGYKPMDYVHALRVEEAKQLLETDDSTIEEIGEAVGYEDPTSFRRLFKRKAGVTPAAYRRKFAKIGATVMHAASVARRRTAPALRL